MSTSHTLQQASFGKDKHSIVASGGDMNLGHANCYENRKDEKFEQIRESALNYQKQQDLPLQIYNDRSH